MSRLIKKVLINNRGEIACRVMRTARRMGIESVAVYSDADKESLHVASADSSIHIGGSAPMESYLNSSKVVEAALSVGAHAIHPGYGFLSEKSDFANLCGEKGIIFVGPPSFAIKAMGSKSESKKIMVDAGVPVVPGYHGQDQTPSLLKEEADKIGYPVLIKAVMGGGGKGMKIAKNPSEFHEQLQNAISESQKSFNDSSVILEKYITNPRHIEFQVFTDMHGNAVHLFERDCSIQRRHQKVVEEAPSGLDETQRMEMGESAKQAALAVKYVGAGTVEFIFDEDAQQFYFMEMNTRLQVEHPITEMITGVDLVEWQFKIAMGNPLPLTQKEVTRNGFSMECRVCAEDPFEDFAGSPGRIISMWTPSISKDIRIDTGFRAGDEISPFYDSMISKLIVKGQTREEVVALMDQCLSEYKIGGISTNIPILREIIKNPEFKDYNYNTNFIDKVLFASEFSDEERAIGSICIVLNGLRANQAEGKKHKQEYNPWFTASYFRINHYKQSKIKFVDGESVQLEFRENSVVASIGNQEFEFRAKHIEEDKYMIEGKGGSGVWRLVDGDKGNFWLVDSKGQIRKMKTESLEVDEDDMLVATSDVTSPLHGEITKIFVKENDVVERGSVLFAISSMKMEYLIRAGMKSTVKKIFNKENDVIGQNQLIIKLEEIME